MRDNDLKNKIMRRVYAIWLFKKITGALTLEVFSFAAILFILFSSYVSFFDVMKNAFGHSSLYDLSAYFFNSFMLTDLVSQILILGAIATFILFNWEIVKNQFRTSLPL